MNKIQCLMKIWVSKSFTNFAGISLRLYQNRKLATDQYRCCREPEQETFHIFEYSNRILCNKRKDIIDKLFNSILNWEVEDEVKELIYQILAGNEEYKLLYNLYRVYNDIVALGK